MDRDEASRILSNLPNGTFLIRVSNSASRRGEHALSIRSGLSLCLRIVLKCFCGMILHGGSTLCLAELVRSAVTAWIKPSHCITRTTWRVCLLSVVVACATAGPVHAHWPDQQYRPGYESGLGHEIMSSIFRHVSYRINILGSQLSPSSINVVPV